MIKSYLCLQSFTDCADKSTPRGKCHVVSSSSAKSGCSRGDVWTQHWGNVCESSELSRSRRDLLEREKSGKNRRKRVTLRAESGGPKGW